MERVAGAGRGRGVLLSPEREDTERVAPKVGVAEAERPEERLGGAACAVRSSSGRIVLSAIVGGWRLLEDEWSPPA